MNKINQELSESKVIREYKHDLVVQTLVLYPEITGNHDLINDQLVSQGVRTVRTKRSLASDEILERRDKSTDITDLGVLDDSLYNDRISNWEFNEEQNILDDETNFIIEEVSKEDVKNEENNISENTKPSELLTSEDAFFDLGHPKIITPVKQNSIDTQAKIADSVNHIKANIESARLALKIPHQTIKNRLMGLSNESPAIAAGGDDVARVGIWGSNGFAISKQGANGSIASYKGRIRVLTIGADIEFNDRDILGIAYSNTTSKLRFSEALGKSHINSHIVHIYSQHELGSNIYLQLIGSTSTSEIRNRINIEYHGKSHVGSIVAEGNITYRYACSNGIHLLPTIGLNYQAQGAVGYMLKVRGKLDRIFSRTVGGKVILKPITLGSNIQLIPTLQGSVEKNFLVSRKQVVGSFASNKILPGEIKVDMPSTERVGYNIGAGVIAQSQNIKLQFDYNYYIHKKYRSYEGSVKLKINL
ncbi:MAG TPA: autotransporter outer membrane beta-barrel domain-containing protein [Rickettsia endosymbiont of Ceroptres masudai]|nr:autotransporter outer membrane beta-barrel domain-containing protein [Rickettsia endosymbiont of Ceroptres masudai]